MKIKRARRIFYIIVVALLLLFVYYFFVAKVPIQATITWGVNFSQTQATSLGLDWKKTYQATLGDLGVTHVKLLTQWDLIETEKDTFAFSDIDWQVQQAESHGAELIYVVGMKSGRWPECHLPGWVQGFSKEIQQEELLDYIEKTVLRYRDNNTIVAWQAENEPLFKFGTCPWYDKDFLTKEIALIKSLDPTRPVIVSDSGELSLWYSAAKRSDILGVTMYKKRWVDVYAGHGFYMDTIFPPKTYRLKADIIHALLGKETICVELQGEPWSSKFISETSLAEQEKTMSLDQFKKNVQYAKQTGFDTFYFWGVEWWYWLKETKERPELWQEAKTLF